MKKPVFLMLMGLALVVAALPWGINQAYGNGGQVDTNLTYFANSPLGTIATGTKYGGGHVTGAPLHKFVDKLPGLGATNANTIGQYIPVATPATLNGDDYYEIGLKDLQSSDAFGPAAHHGYFRDWDQTQGLLPD